MNCDHDGQSFIVAVDRATGQEKWRTLRTAKSQYATPILIEHKGLSQIVVNGELIVSYDAAGGQELWTCRGMKKAPDVVVPTPLYRNGLVYFTCGRNGPTMAVDPGGAGDVTDTHMRMYVPTGGSYVPSPLFYPTLLLPNDDGLLRFLDEKGKAIVTHKLAGRFTSSPVGAEGRMYWAAENGDTFVVDVSQAAQGSVRFLGVNHLGESCLASPAVAGGRIYIRTSKHLFCIGNLGAKRPSQARPPPAGNRGGQHRQIRIRTRGQAGGARQAVADPDTQGIGQIVSQNHARPSAVPRQLPCFEPAQPVRLLRLKVQVQAFHRCRMGFRPTLD